MRYIFTETEKIQSIRSVRMVYDIDTTILYSFDFTESRLTIEYAARKRRSCTVFSGNQAILFWQQLAVQVDQRCSVKDVKDRMLALIKGVDSD